VRSGGKRSNTLADRHGVVTRTIQNWLNRFEEQPIEQAPYDAPRPGGPAKIDGEEREQLFEQLQQPPTELGYDQQAWSAKLLLHHVKEEYNVEYHGYFPSKLPELNAVEGCWDQLQEWFKHRLVPDLSTLEEYLPRALNAISEPDIWPYLTSKDSS